MRCLSAVCSLLMVTLATSSLADTPHIPGRQTALIPLDVSSVEASSVFPAEATASYEAENVIDREPSTAWFGAREEETPSLVFRFPQPVVVHAIEVINGWVKNDANWRYNSRARGIELTLEDGTRWIHTLRDEQMAQMVPMQWKPTSTLTIRILSRHPGEKAAEIGLSEVAFLGRFHDPSALRFEDVAFCTVTFQRELQIDANSPVSEPMRTRPLLYLRDEVEMGGDGSFVTYYDAEEYPVEVRVAPPAVSPNVRVVKTGRSFRVTNIEHVPQRATMLVCDDGTRIALAIDRHGSLRSQHGQLTMEEMNSLFAGELVFSEWGGRTVEEY